MHLERVLGIIPDHQFCHLADVTKILFAMEAGGSGKLPSLVIRVLPDRQAKVVGDAIIANAVWRLLSYQVCDVVLNCHAASNDSSSPRLILAA